MGRTHPVRLIITEEAEPIRGQRQEAVLLMVEVEVEAVMGIEVMVEQEARQERQ